MTELIPSPSQVWVSLFISVVIDETVVSKLLHHKLMFLFFQLYKFGETVSIVFWTDTWRPESFFDKVKKNRQNGTHTLCLLGKCSAVSLESQYGVVILFLF